MTVKTCFGAFTLDSNLRQVTRQDREIHLTPKAFDLLTLLVADAGRVVTKKKELHERLWPDTFVSDATLVGLVKLLRRTLGDYDARAPIIRTSHGVGYAFVSPIQRSSWHAEDSHQVRGARNPIPSDGGENIIGRNPASAADLDADGVVDRRPRLVVDEPSALVENVAGVNHPQHDVLCREHAQRRDGDDLHMGVTVMGDRTAATRRSVAVLPFADLSPQHDHVYLGEGIAEELIHALSAIDGLKVSARSSSFQFAGKALNIREVGARLAVDTILEGSIRTAEHRLRLTARLVDVRDECQIWSERYDRTLEDVFAVQEDIACAIVAKLQLTLQPEHGRGIVQRHTDDLEAYGLYLQGRYHWSRRAEGFLRMATACFEQAIDRDASYALAHAGLADAYAVVGAHGNLSSRAVWNKAKLAAQRAVLLNDELSEGHHAMASVHLSFDWDFGAAEREFRRAIALDPRSGLTHALFGYLLVILGRFEEAIAVASRGRTLEPTSTLVAYYLAGVFGYARRCDDGLDECRRAIDLDPFFSPGTGLRV